MHKHYKLIDIKKYFYLAIAALLLSVTPALSQDAPKPQAVLGNNLLKNAGFEEGQDNWSIAKNTATVVSDHHYSGNHSLYYKNENTKRHELFCQQLKLTPGKQYQLTAWIKVANVSGGNGTIGMQSYDANGKSLPGSLVSARGLKRTEDWKQAKMFYTVPEKASRTDVIFYLKEGGIGEVWFDDAELRSFTPAPFISTIKYPNYRNIVKQGDHLPWRYQVEINQAANWKNAPIKITNTLVDSKGKVLLSSSDSIAASQKSVMISFAPPADLAAGQYTLLQHVTDPNGKTYLADQQTINIVEQMPKVYIDAQGFTVVDGQRFFPMGLYLRTRGTSDENMKRIAAGGFNTILTYDYGYSKDYEAYMDRAEAHQLKVVYSTGKSTRWVERLRDKPALLAWYSKDEPNEDELPALREVYAQFQQKDINHPVFLVQNKDELIAAHYDNADILGGDPYPVGTSSLYRTSQVTQLTVEAAGNVKGVWMVPQLMNWKNYGQSFGHWPTLDEMRNQVFQAIIYGAKGMIFYSYYDLMFPDSHHSKGTLDMKFFQERWALVTQMSSEINGIIPVVLEDKKIALDLLDESRIQVSALQNGNEVLLLMANPDYEQKSITFKLPDGWGISDADQGQIKSTFTNGQATFTLPSMGCGVFRLTHE